MNINLTRQQLAILGGLLLAGYLVFCGFGCVLGIGMREPAAADVSQETTRPTLVSTDTPVPISTSGPTDTPVPTATLTRVIPVNTPTRPPTLTPLRSVLTAMAPTRTPTPSLAVDIIDARIMCEEWIEDRSATGKVKFLWLTNSDFDLGNYHYKIMGECESQNLFGATIRYKYACELHADLDRRVWVLDALFIE
jgi:hypothetical protein